ncbi:MAG TPA: hypothetical protein VFU37_07235 [Pyrinomonadaceae bacterium]|nr:hypothetical protein [Pyrinomonadaceae bacterium]
MPRNLRGMINEPLERERPVMKQWTGLAALGQREQKTASLRRFLAAIPRTQRKRFGLMSTQRGGPAALGNQLETALSLSDWRPACRSLTRRRSTRLIAAIRRLGHRRHCG